MSRNFAFYILVIPLIFLIIAGCEQPVERVTSQKGQVDIFPTPAIDFAPRRYVCYRTDFAIDVDGRMDEAAWEAAPWTEEFVDIQGDAKPEPRFKTRARMLWDDDYFYVAARLIEPHIWAKLTDRDAIIFYDNDFEVFIDPDGDTHEYYEFEMNALNTVWDLLLVKPYRDGAPAIDSWDIQGLQSAVSINGSINDPEYPDSSWTVEIAFPWKVLEECAHKTSPPRDGDQWRINFSRVQWQVDIIDSAYVKRVDPETGQSLPEDNWVWSPQGLINMHYPEMWGFVQFTSKSVFTKNVTFEWLPVEEAKWILRQIYYAQKDHFKQFDRYTDSARRLNLLKYKAGSFSWPPELEVTPNQFEAAIYMKSTGQRLWINHEGRTWTE